MFYGKIAVEKWRILWKTSKKLAVLELKQQKKHYDGTKNEGYCQK